MSSVRRVVTGHDADGAAIIVEDATPLLTHRVGGENGPLFHEVWSTREMPARIDAVASKVDEGVVLAPPRNGTRIRVVDFPAEDGSLEQLTPEEIQELFKGIGAPDVSAVNGGRTVRHAHMHRTQTIDYGIVLEGEIVLIMDEGEVTVRAGDIVVQRGTNHGWANRSGSNCRIAFVLVDGTFDEALITKGESK